MPKLLISQYRNTISQLLCVATFLQSTSAFGAVAVPGPPEVGACADCIGEVNTTLNVCADQAPSCVSSYNDDQEHFMAPWEYVSFADSAAIKSTVDADATDKAVQQLIKTATTGYYKVDLRRSSPVAALEFSVESAFEGSKIAPEYVKQVPFNGVVQDTHITEDGSQYVRITFGLPADGSGTIEDSSDLIDAEFVFLEGDTICDVRAASRTDPSLKDVRYDLSLQKGVRLDYNKARKLMMRLRIALGWEVTPVITGFGAESALPQGQFWIEKALDFIPLTKFFTNRN